MPSPSMAAFAALIARAEAAEAEVHRLTCILASWRIRYESDPEQRMAQAIRILRRGKPNAIAEALAAMEAPGTREDGASGEPEGVQGPQDRGATQNPGSPDRPMPSAPPRLPPTATPRHDRR